jgi:hypothetical protein
MSSLGFIRNPLSRFAYYKCELTGNLSLYINGNEHGVEPISKILVEKIANNRTIFLQELLEFFDNSEDIAFLFELWKLHIIDFLSEEI